MDNIKMGLWESGKQNMNWIGPGHGPVFLWYRNDYATSSSLKTGAV
jgi:hypothetical protein